MVWVYVHTYWGEGYILTFALYVHNICRTLIDGKLNYVPYHKYTKYSVEILLGIIFMTDNVLKLCCVNSYSYVGSI